jgi:hypothetical protein
MRLLTSHDQLIVPRFYFLRGVEGKLCRNFISGLHLLFVRLRFRWRPMPRPQQKAAAAEVAVRMLVAVATSVVAAAVRTSAPGPRYPVRLLGLAPAATLLARQPAALAPDLRSLAAQRGPQHSTRN